MLMRNLGLAALAVTSLTNAAAAWDVVAAGRITKLYYANSANTTPFQVFLDAGLPSCTYGFGFLSYSSSTFAPFQTGLTLAFQQDRKVTLYMSKDSSGFCNIGDFAVE